MMNRNIARLLRQHLGASSGAWLCAALAVQFFVTSGAWALDSRRELLPGVVLLVLAGTQSAPARGLAWRVLPICRRELALALWYATTFLPGLTVSCAVLLAAANNRDVGWSVPSAHSIFLQLAGVWSAFGITAWLPLGTRLDSSLRGVSLAIATWSIPLFLAFYGYPLLSPGRIVSIILISMGGSLLVLSFLRANTGRILRAERSLSARPRNADETNGPRFETHDSRFIRPSVGAQILWMVSLGLGGSCLLKHLYPEDNAALLWPFMLTVSVGSVLAGQRWTHSLWPWRALPMAAWRATLTLEAVQLLPLGVALGASWALGRIAPQIALPIPTALPPAAVAIAGLASVYARAATRKSGESYWIRRWLASVIALSYMSILLVMQLAAHRFTAVAGLIWIGACALLVLSYRLMLSELRTPDTLRIIRQ